MNNKKGIGKKIGEQIEKVFDIENRLRHNDCVTIQISEIQEKISGYSSGNGHSCLRDRSRGGKQMGYLVNKYNLKKCHTNKNNPNSAIEKLEFRKK